MSDTLRLQRDRFVAFSFAAAELLVELGTDGCVLYASGAAQKLLGIGAQDLVGRSMSELFAVGDHVLVTSLLVRSDGTGRFGPISVRLQHASGRPVSAVLNGCRLPGRQDSLYLTLNAATASRAAEALDNRRDAETGLLDAEAFAKVTAENIRVAQAIGQDVKLTLIDVAGFEELKAHAGDHPTDQFLKEVGALLRSRALGEASARLSEDKYGILHDATIDAIGLRERIADLGHEASPEGPGLTVNGNTLDTDEDLDEAEMARALAYTMNRFVETGSEKFSITSMTDAVRTMMGETLQKVTDFKTVVSKKEMQLRFQPIVNLRTRLPHHFEVLVRFEGDNSPYELIKFAESMHLVHEMDLAICEAAMDYLNREDTRGRITLAVNLSAQSLQNDIFVAALLDLVRRHKRIARRLAFEITESTELTELDAANNVIQELRSHGLEICLDDFGAGFASFQYLHALHVDYVKLDGKYIRAVLDSPRDRVMLKSMVGLCGELNIHTVGEMIETETQAGLLAELGVEYGQGWLFGRPLPAPQLAPATAPEPLRAVAGRRGPREA